MYRHMAYYVAEKLHLRPQSILSEWSVPELLVAYGNYANEESKRNLEEWKALPSETRNKQSRPKEYVVKFYA